MSDTRYTTATVGDWLRAELLAEAGEASRELDAWVESVWVPPPADPAGGFRPLKRAVVFRRDSGVPADAALCAFVEAHYAQFGLSRGKGQGKKTRPGVLFQHPDTCAVFVITRSARGTRDVYIGSRPAVRACLGAALASLCVAGGTGVFALPLEEYIVEFSGPAASCTLPSPLLSATYAAFVASRGYTLGDRLLLLRAGERVHGAVRRVFRRFLSPSFELAQRVDKVLRFRAYTLGQLKAEGALAPRDTAATKKTARDLDDLQYAFRTWRVQPLAQFDVLAGAVFAAVVAEWTGGCPGAGLGPTHLVHYLMMMWFGAARRSSTSPFGRWEDMWPPMQARTHDNCALLLERGHRVLWEAGIAAREDGREARTLVAALARIGDAAMTQRCGGYDGLDGSYVRKVFPHRVDGHRMDCAQLEAVLSPVLSCVESAVGIARAELASVRKRIPKGLTMIHLARLAHAEAVAAVVAHMGPAGYAVLHVDGWLPEDSRDGAFKGGDAFYVPIPYHLLHISLEHAFQELDGITQLVLSDPSASCGADGSLYVPFQMLRVSPTKPPRRAENISAIAQGYPVCAGGSVLFVARGWTEILRCVLFYLHERISGSRSSVEIPLFPVVCSWVMPVVRKLARKAAQNPDAAAAMAAGRAGLAAALTDARVVFRPADSAYAPAPSEDGPPAWAATSVAAHLTLEEKVRLVAAFRTVSWWFESNRSSRLLQNLGPLAFSSVAGAVGLLKVIVDVWGAPRDIADEWTLWQTTCVAGACDLGSGWVETSRPCGREAPARYQVAHVPLMEAIRVVTQTDARLEWSDRVHLLLASYLSDPRDAAWAWDPAGPHLPTVQHLLTHETSCCAHPCMVLQPVVPVTVPPAVLRGVWDLLFDPRMPPEVTHSVLFRTTTDNHHEIIDRRGSRFSLAIERTYRALFPALFEDPRAARHRAAVHARRVLGAERPINTMGACPLVARMRRALLMAPPSTGSRAIVHYTTGDAPAPLRYETGRARDAIAAMREIERAALVSNHVIQQGGSRTRWWSQRGDTRASRQREDHEFATDMSAGVELDADLDGFLVDDDEVDDVAVVATLDGAVDHSPSGASSDWSSESPSASSDQGSEPLSASDEEEDEEMEMATVSDEADNTPQRHVEELLAASRSRLTQNVHDALGLDSALESLEQERGARPAQPPLDPRVCVDDWRRVDAFGPRGPADDPRPSKDELEDALYRAMSSPIIEAFRMLERAGYKDDRNTPLSFGIQISHDAIRDETRDFPVIIDKDRAVRADGHPDARAYCTYQESMAMFRIYPAYARVIEDVDLTTVADLTDFWALRKTRAHQ